MLLKERGRALNRTHESLLKQAQNAIKRVLSSVLGDSDKIAAAVSALAKEAADFNQADTRLILQCALDDVAMGSYIIDVYDTNLVYEQGYPRAFYQIDYSMDESGAVVFGTPFEVMRKVSYIPAPAESGIAAVEAGNFAIEIPCTPLPLVEALDKDGLIMGKLITPGWGTSGYYAADVLKRDGPNIFKAGMQSFWDHQTPHEEAQRPEGSLTRLAAVLTENARYLDAGAAPDGAGLYAPMRVYERYRADVKDLINDMGLSINAHGKARMGEAEGKRGPIVEAITSAKSVDFVTRAGAGGKALALFESAGTRQAPDLVKEQDDMSAQEIAELKETIAKQQSTIDAIARSNAQAAATRVIDRHLATYHLPADVEARIALGLADVAPLTEAGTLDTAKLVESVNTAVQSELGYLSRVSGFRVSGVGSGTQDQPAAIDVEKELTGIFVDLGMTESAAKVGAAGR